MFVGTPLTQAVLCMESDGHTNIEYSVAGSCEKSLCDQPKQSSSGHVDNCENCTDISLSQNFVVSKSDFQSVNTELGCLQTTWITNAFSLEAPEFKDPLQLCYFQHKLFSSSTLAHRQTIVLLI